MIPTPDTSNMKPTFRNSILSTMDFSTGQKRSMKWTDKDRLQLIEAVIRVEQEMISEWKKANQHSADGPVVGKWNSVWSSTAKWNAIANLLPRKLGEKYWNPRRKVYHQPKCCGMFHNLVKVYRDKVGGKASASSRLQLSEPVREILRRREDLINGRSYSVPDISFSKSVPLKRVDASRSLHHDGNRQKQITPTGNSSMNTYTSSLNIRTCSKKVQVKWTEAARLQVIKAVMKVEQEMMTEMNREGGCSRTSTRKGKWDRIADLLAPGFRGRLWKARDQTHGEHKCSRMFYNLTSAYRGRFSARKVSRCCSGALTKNVVKLLTKREELLNGTSRSQEGKQPFISGHSTRIGTRKSSHQLSRNQWRVRESLQNSSADIEISSQPGQFIGLERETGACSFSQKADGSESLEGSEKFTQNESNVGTVDRPRDHTRHEKLVDRQTSGPYLGFRRRSKDPAINAEPDGSRSGVETRGQTRAKMRDCSSSTNRPDGQSSTLRAKRQRTTSMPHSPHDEHLVTVLERSLQRIDNEFLFLSSWVQSKAIRDEFKSSVILLAKKRKVDATQSCVGEMIRVTKKMIDHQVRALFYNLRIRFAVELNNACEELAQEVMEGVLKTSRRSSQFK